MWMAHLAILLSTPFFSSSELMVTGRVAELTGRRNCVTGRVTGDR